ncbi:MAG: ATP synthase F1 subunit epsilon [Actinomycetota bacterium]|uniref:ATP synthase F1 complex delta/epsilon subunit N-terminal domain-containing protein n=1 Tax=marine metagenome TaxID=408172 RepID=A0A381PEU1_9ZZZZ|nr:ATP synthase F1 subunit epsilon [Actinomycetota bacterium]MED5553056.1 ATP synthase F1 subunit epsilon [Actinomycetota bacterium]MEE3186847.1 ATP synthase F1 subunit epsilon [Actinomycetota bacterium]|tara:strand:+ start:88 stop:471 length:384 start_codon:yes stop_codon:yes gene_type:complete
MQVELVSPEAVLFSGECSQVVTRTVDGDIAFLDNHAPFIGALDIGQTQLWATDGVISLAINGGFVEVSGNAVTILSDGAMAAQEVDPSEAESDLAIAEEALASDADDQDAANAKKWAETRLQVAATV